MPGIVIKIEETAPEQLEEIKKWSITTTGQQVNIIADSERASFGIGTDDDLKNAVGNHMKKKPKHAYLKSPTPKGDLYEQHGVLEVERVLKIKKAEILEVETKPTNLTTSLLQNESDKVTTCTTKILAQVTDSVSNTWSKSSQVSADQTIKFEVGFRGVKGSSETKIGFEHTWGKSGTVSKQSTVGMEAGVNVELKPGESAMVELSASLGTMRVRITYEAYLRGSVIAKYCNTPSNKKDVVWSIPINYVIGDFKTVEIVQDVEVGFYSKANVKVKNANANEEIMFFIADLLDEPSSDDHPDVTPSE